MSESFAFDNLVGFLRGPVWNIPILTFIENKSLIFEPDSYDDDEHKKIHEEYKNLVDFMLGSHMEDMGIKPEQFDAACGKASSNIKDKFHQTLFEQVWAADDYEIFKRMMIQKNIELQLQALELLQKKHGIIPESFIPGDSMTEDEQSVMEQVIKKSLEEYEAYQQEMDVELKELERAIAASQEDKARLEEDNRRGKELLQEALTKAPEDRTLPQQTKKKEVDSEDLQKRQEYLRSQRDKLLAMKKEEREKQLAAYEKTIKQTRPKSSRAARKAMKGQSIDPQTLQIRRALAERLKAEEPFSLVEALLHSFNNDGAELLSKNIIREHGRFAQKLVLEKVCRML